MGRVSRLFMVGVRDPDGSDIYEKGSDNEFIGNIDKFFLLTPTCAGKGF